MTSDKTKQFFHTLFDKYIVLKQLIEIRYMKPDKSMEKSYITDIDDFFKQIDEGYEVVKNYDVWFAVCPRNKQSGEKAAIKYVPHLWCDVDFKNKGEEETKQIMGKFPIKPSFTIFSGHGYHLYWLLKEHIEIKEGKDIDLIEGINRGIANFYSGTTDGYDISKSLRVPDTINNSNHHKTKENKPIKTEITQSDPTIIYDIELFKPYYKPNENTAVAIEISQSIKNIELKELKLKHWVKKLITDGWEQDSKYKSRSEADEAVMVALLDSGYDDETIYSIFTNQKFKISEKAMEKRTKEAANYLQYSIAKAKQYREDRQKQWVETVSKFKNFEEVEQVYYKWLHIEDPDYLKIIHATVISHSFDADPVWLLVVAPPSGTKTSVIEPIGCLPNTYPISIITPKTLLSGDPKSKDASMLYRLTPMDKLHENQTYSTKTHGILLFKDLTTVLQLRGDDRSDILQQLREVYDGQYTKVFGSGRVKELSWSGKVTMLAGVTEYYEAFRQVDQTLGERYLLYKPIVEIGRQKMALKSMMQIGHRKDMSGEFRLSISEYHKSLSINPDITQILLPDSMAEKLSVLSDFVTRARSSVKRDFRGDIEYIPQPELPARLGKQIAILAKALTIINKHSEVTDEEIRLVSKLAHMTIATDRYGILQTLFIANAEYVETSVLQREVKLPKTSMHRCLENLEIFGLVEHSSYTKGESYQWKLTELSRELLEGIKQK